MNSQVSQIEVHTAFETATYKGRFFIVFTLARSNGDLPTPEFSLLTLEILVTLLLRQGLVRIGFLRLLL